MLTPINSEVNSFCDTRNIINCQNSNFGDCQIARSVSKLESKGQFSVTTRALGFQNPRFSVFCNTSDISGMTVPKTIFNCRMTCTYNHREIIVYLRPYVIGTFIDEIIYLAPFKQDSGSQLINALRQKNQLNEDSACGT